MGGISFWQVLVILAVIVLLFGGKRLRSFGSDLGTAIKGFKKEMDAEKKEGEDKPQIDKNDDDEPTKH
ncbi:twin-arginine translocase TatA/TatE family subunit [Aliidiomarina sp.]|uniref:twin-arginine translocase TatA/TatE family subunit n=1 Tax=Aliidiomarina sp. TaxID=1872439 RepID=UPI003A4E3606